MKIKITITTVYEVNEAEEGLTPEQILAIDLINIEDDPSIVFSGSSSNYKVTGEIIK